MSLSKLPLPFTMQVKGGTHLVPSPHTLCHRERLSLTGEKKPPGGREERLEGPDPGFCCFSPELDFTPQMLLPPQGHPQAEQRHQAWPPCCHHRSSRRLHQDQVTWNNSPESRRAGRAPQGVCQGEAGTREHTWGNGGLGSLWLTLSRLAAEARDSG